MSNYVVMNTNIATLLKPKYSMPLWYIGDERFLPELNEINYFRLIFVEAGAGIVRLNDRRRVFLAPSIFCLNDQDQPELEKSNDLKAKAFYFHPKIINSIYNFENIRRNNRQDFSETEFQDQLFFRPFLLRFDQYGGQLNIGPVTAKRVIELIDRVCKELDEQSDRYWACRSRSTFIELLFLIIRIFETPGTFGHSNLPELGNQDVDLVILYLHSNYEQKITLSQLTNVFHINRTTINRRFAEVTGMSIMTYLQALRIQLASVMLRETNLPILEVMNKVGFNDPTHFGRVFRKHTGFAPSDYRQQYCWMIK